MQLLIDEDKWINYIVHVESKQKDCLKVLNNEEKISEKELDSICLVATTSGILYGSPKVHKTVVNNTPNFTPILSATNRPSYSLAKLLNLIITYN